MWFLRRVVTHIKKRREPRFENYRIQTGYTNVGHVPYASIREFPSLVATGETPDEAIWNLRAVFEQCVRQMQEMGEPVPLPGSGRAKVQFAPNDQVEVLRPLVDEFWSEILGTSYSTSFVSNQSSLSSWDHYLSGGRIEVIERVKEKYGVDISAYYDEPIPFILRRIHDATS